MKFVTSREFPRILYGILMIFGNLKADFHCYVFAWCVCVQKSLNLSKVYPSTNQYNNECILKHSKSFMLPFKSINYSITQC